ncbi:MAG: All-trans-phytoene synthase [Planctomycetota bacterium]|jgi:squalene synthase HpnC
MKAGRSIVAEDLPRFGPDQTVAVPEAEAQAYCRSVVGVHRENFSVLSPLVPEHCRGDFAAVYAFCRWADDLGDEAGSPERALELLAWWRRELDAMVAGEARHPVFVALRTTFVRHALDARSFHQLLDAFELDQRKDRYRSWDELLGYCSLSANPVGRIVLRVLGERCDDAQLAASDALCTALQLTNHWQDIRRDWVERRRIYVPADMHEIDGFERRLDETIARGFSADRAFWTESRRLVRRLVARTWDIYAQAEPLVPSASPAAQPLLWLFAAGGRTVLWNIERWNCETVLERPKLSAPRKAALVLRALAMRRFAWYRPRLQEPSAWIVDPEPDPEAGRFPLPPVADAVPDAASDAGPEPTRESAAGAGA